jgi:hypothetical protein
VSASLDHFTLNTFMTSSPRWLMTLTAMRLDLGSSSASFAPGADEVDVALVKINDVAGNDTGRVRSGDAGYHLRPLTNGSIPRT